MTPDVDRGELVAAVAGCAACHTAEGGVSFAGGYAVETTWGTFYGSNLTPDPVAGLGGWSAEDFSRALRDGRAPDGRPYVPAFPYASFTGLSDGDVADLWAYLQAVPADPTPSRPHEARAIATSRLGLGLWRRFAFRPGLPAADRGDYLVGAVAHCGECHTPRNGMGKMRTSRAMAGNGDPPAPAPNITPGALPWTVEDWSLFLEIGLMPDGNGVGGEMSRVIEQGTSRLPEVDRRAIGATMVRVRPVARRGREEGDDEDL